VSDNSEQLQQQVKQAHEDKTLLNIQAGGSKYFLGTVVDAPTIDISNHSGVISYEPTELVITARAGTPLSIISSTLLEQGQWLPFEPPAFGPTATIGGTIACALAGPARPYLGGARDYILGCRILNGRGEILRFGGEVMKNVAGYDVSRLMTGAMGTLGVLLDVSLKVLPKASQDITLARSCDTAKAIEDMQRLAGLGLPVTASAYIDGVEYIRLSGSNTVTLAAAKKLDGDISNDHNGIWHQLAEQALPFFEAEHSLWRISVPPLTEQLNVEGRWLYDWAGMQRWLVSDAPATTIRQTAESAGGHATLYKAHDAVKKDTSAFHPPPAPLLTLQKRLKNEFDPQGIFNHQRLFPEF